MFARLLIIKLCFFTVVSGFSQTNKQGLIKEFGKEIQQVRGHFKAAGDPVKIKAADFLLRNLFFHYTKTTDFKQPNGDTYDFNELDYDNVELANKDLKCFKEGGGSYKHKTSSDLETIKASFIIDVVNTSVDTWQNGQWKDKYDFKTFCEYILPYRNATEPVDENWKSKYYEIYKPVLKNAEDPSDPVSVCTKLLQEMDYFDFQEKRINPQPFLSIDQMHFRRKGNCIDLASLSVLSARSIGLAVTYDFTPYHAASSSAHSWNTVVNNEGNHIPFNSNLAMPYVYDPNYRRLGKVLRRVFSNPEENLLKIVPVTEVPNKILRKRNVIDVTNEYVETTNISYNFNKKVPNDLAYITVYNKAKWKALWWGRVDEKGKAAFKNMGTNVVYLPATTQKVSKNGKQLIGLNYEQYPIQVLKGGATKTLKPDFKNVFNCSLSKNNEVTGPYRDFNSLALEEGAFYNLHYWDKEWILHGKSKVINEKIAFDKVPNNALFRLTPLSPDGFERVFCIDKTSHKIIWY